MSVRLEQSSPNVAECSRSRPRALALRQYRQCTGDAPDARCRGQVRDLDRPSCAVGSRLLDRSSMPWRGLRRRSDTTSPRWRGDRGERATDGKQTAGIGFGVFALHPHVRRPGRARAVDDRVRSRPSCAQDHRRTRPPARRTAGGTRARRRAYRAALARAGGVRSQTPTRLFHAASPGTCCDLRDGLFLLTSAVPRSCRPTAASTLRARARVRAIVRRADGERPRDSRFQNRSGTAYRRALRAYCSTTRHVRARGGDWPTQLELLSQPL